MNELEQMFSTPQATQQVVPMPQIDPETGEVHETELSVAPVVVDQNAFDFDALEKASVGASIVPMYWSPTQKGQKSRGYYQGTAVITKNEPDGEKQITVVRWINKEGLFMNGGAGFVKLFKDLPEGTAIELEYLGKENTQSGHKVNTFDLKLLNL